MDNRHFVYAIDCGTYDKNGLPLRIFGISSQKTFAGRLRAYLNGALKKPVLCGAIVCRDKQDALDTEKAVLSLLSEYAPVDRPEGEIRIGHPNVLEFIETEMMDSEEFLQQHPIVAEVWPKRPSKGTPIGRPRKFAGTARERERNKRKGSAKGQISFL